MRKACLLCLILPCLAGADYQPTSYQFANWTVDTSENLYLGHSYTSYPVTNLFDGSLSTAWVFSGPKVVKKEDATENLWSGRYGIAITPHRAVKLDGIDLMNGYAKSPETFARNRRVVEVAIYDCAQPYNDRKPIKTVRLADRQGWHHISLPRKTYADGLSLVFRKFAGDEEADVALSELRLSDRGRKLPILEGKAYGFTVGSDCGCGTEWDLLDFKHRIVARFNQEGASLEGDEAGRYVAGLQTRGDDWHRPTLWIADWRTAKVVYRRKLPYTKQGYGFWTDPKTQLTKVFDDKRNLPIPFPKG